MIPPFGQPEIFPERRARTLDCHLIAKKKNQHEEKRKKEIEFNVYIYYRNWLVTSLNDNRCKQRKKQTKRQKNNINNEREFFLVEEETKRCVISIVHCV